MELKEIAGYLPYKLKVKVDTSEWFEKRDTFIAQLIGIFDLEHLTVKYLDETNSSYTDNMLRFKPILRPLSDLVNPCLEEGKTPLVELAKMAFPSCIWCIKNGIVTANDGGRDFEYYRESFWSNDYGIFYQLQLFEWLYEHHFWLGDQSRFGQDIIDINTL